MNLEGRNCVSRETKEYSAGPFSLNEPTWLFHVKQSGCLGFQATLLYINGVSRETEILLALPDPAISLAVSRETIRSPVFND